MSTNGYSGRTLKILRNGVRIAAVQTKSVTHSKSEIDRSGEEKDGWRHVDPVPDLMSVDISCVGVAKATNFHLLDDWYETGELIDISIEHPDGTVETPAEGAFLRTLTHNGEHDGFVAFEAQFLLSGSL